MSIWDRVGAALSKPETYMGLPGVIYQIAQDSGSAAEAKTTSNSFAAALERNERGLFTGTEGSAAFWRGLGEAVNPADDITFWEGADEAVGAIGGNLSAQWEAATAIPGVGGAIEGAGGWVTDQLAAYQAQVIEPILDYGKAESRFREDIAAQQDAGEISFIDFMLQDMGAQFGLTGLLDGDDFSDKYLKRERETTSSLGQYIDQRYLRTGGQYNPETGQVEYSLLDDPNSDLKRAEFYSEGPQRLFSGVIDIAANLAADPLSYVTAGGGGAGTKATRITSDVAETAADTSFGGQAARTTFEAREAADRSVETLSELRVTELREKARNYGITGYSKMRKTDLADAIAGREVREFQAPQLVEGEELIAGTSRWGRDEYGVIDVAPGVDLGKDFGARWRVGAPEVRSNVERVVDYVRSKQGEAGVWEDLANDPLLRQVDDPAPLVNAMRMASEVVAPGLSDDVARGVMADTLYAAMGSRSALNRLSDVSEKLAYDAARITDPSWQHARTAVLADESIAFRDRLTVINDDQTWKAEAAVLAEDLKSATAAIDDARRSATLGVDPSKLGPASGGTQITNLSGNAIERALAFRGSKAGDFVTVAEGRTNWLSMAARRGAQWGATAAVGGLRWLQNGERFYRVTGLRVPHTLDVNEPAANDLFRQHVARQQKLLARNRFERSDGVLSVSDEDLGALRELASAGDAWATSSGGMKGLQGRVNAVGQFNDAAEGLLKQKMTREYVAKELRNGNDEVLGNQGIIADEIDSWVQAWKERRADMIAQVRESLQATDDPTLDVSTMKLDAENILSFDSRLAEGLTKDSVVDMIDWSDAYDFIASKYRMGMNLNDVRPQSLKRATGAAVAVMDELNDLLKVGMLARPIAYPLRNALDSQLRILATQRTGVHMAIAMRGMGNFFRNFKRVSDEDVLLYQRKVSASRRVMELSEDLDILEAQRDFMVDRVKQQKQKGHKAQRKWDFQAGDMGLIEGRIVALREVLEREQSILDMTREDFRVEQQRVANMPVRERLGEIEAEQKFLRQEIENLKKAGAAVEDIDEIRHRLNAVGNERRRLASWQQLDDVDDTTPKPGKKRQRRGTALRAQQGYDGHMDLKTGEFVPASLLDAYDSPSGIKYHEERSQSSIMAVLETNRNASWMRESKVKQTRMSYSVKNADKWNQTYATQINGYLRTDEAAMMYLNNQNDLARVYEWADRTAEGREWAKNFGAGKLYADTEEAVNAVVAFVDEMLPSMDMRVAAARADITPEDAQRWYTEALEQQRSEVGFKPPEDANNSKYIKRPNLFVPERQFQDNITFASMDKSYMAKAGFSAFKNVRNAYFRNFSALPEAYWSRHPFYINATQKHAETLFNSLGVRKADLTTKKGRATAEAALRERYTIDEINGIMDQARSKAKKEILNTLYDTSKRSNLQHTMRIVSPFLAAWQDAWFKWAKIAADKPFGAYMTFQGFQNWDQLADRTVDSEGNRILSSGEVVNAEGEVIGTADPNEGYAIFQLPEPIAKKFGVDNIRLSKQSASVILQGEQPWIPGAGPMVAVAHNELLKQIGATKLAEDLQGVTDVILPFGMEADSADLLKPTWLRAWNDFITQDGTRVTSAYQKMAADLYSLEQAGEWSGTQAEFEEEVSRRTRNWTLLRAIGTEMPVSTTPGSRLDGFIAEYHNFYRPKYGDEAEDRFLEDHPDYAGAVISFSANDTGIQATLEAQQQALDWKGDIGRNPAIGGILTGPANYTGEFSETIYDWQKMTRISQATEGKWRGRQSQADTYDRLHVSNGWKEFARVQHVIDLTAEEYGYSSLEVKDAEWLKVAKDQIVSILREQNPAWAVEYDQGATNGTNPLSEIISDTYSAIAAKPEALNKPENAHLKTFAEYVEAREQIISVMEAVGFASADSQQFQESEIGAAWAAIVEKLKRDDPSFADIYNRYGFERDTLSTRVVVN